MRTCQNIAYLRFVTYSFLLFMILQGISISLEIVQNKSESEIRNKIDFNSEQRFIYLESNAYLFAFCIGVLINTLEPLKLGVF